MFGNFINVDVLNFLIGGVGEDAAGLAVQGDSKVLAGIMFVTI